MLHKEQYVVEGETSTSLQNIAIKMIELKHSIVYKNFYSLILFLLTLPVTAASCERAHSKVDLIKSSVRASMGSERLEDLVIISSEKSTLDSLEMSVIVNELIVTYNGNPRLHKENSSTITLIIVCYSPQINAFLKYCQRITQWPSRSFAL